MEELFLLLSEKLGLAFDYVEENLPDVYEKVVESQIHIYKIDTIVFQFY